MLRPEAKNKGANNMYIVKGEEQSWSDINKIVSKFWSGNLDDSEIVEAWDRSVDEAMKQIRESVAKLPEKDREVQAKIRWEDWQKKNEKPKIVDQIERYHRSLKIKPISQNDMKEFTEYLKKRSVELEEMTPDERKKHYEMSRMQINPKSMSSFKEWFKLQNGK